MGRKIFWMGGGGCGSLGVDEGEWGWVHCLIMLFYY